MIENVPGGHDTHVDALDAPRVVENVPAAQTVQTLAPIKAEKEPAAHKEHTVDPNRAEKEPNGQKYTPTVPFTDNDANLNRLTLVLYRAPTCVDVKAFPKISNEPK